MNHLPSTFSNTLVATCFPQLPTLGPDQLQAGDVANVASDMDLHVLQVDLQRELVVGVADHLPALHHHLVPGDPPRRRVHHVDVVALGPGLVHRHEVAVLERRVEPRVRREDRGPAVLLEHAELVPQRRGASVVLLLDRRLELMSQGFFVRGAGSGALRAWAPFGFAALDVSSCEPRGLVQTGACRLEPCTVDRANVTACSAQRKFYKKG